MAVAFKPTHGAAKIDRFPKTRMIAELIENEERDARVFRQSPNRGGWPDAFLFLKARQVIQPAFDGHAVAITGKKCAKTESGGRQITPAAVVLLFAKNCANEAGIERQIR